MDKSKETKTYEVVLYKSNSGPLLVHTDNNKERAKQLVLKLSEQWTKCIKDQTPFLLESPIFSSFDPGLIREISVIESTLATGADNPYQQEMVNKGFTESFKSQTKVNQSPYSELLDKGFK